jgi:hypothetical protein
MKLERDVIIDLLPVYFSGEASAATRSLVEDYFRQDPDFEKIARGASRPLEALQLPAPEPEKEQEKAALECARTAVQTRASYLWLAICFTVLLLLFKIRNHKLVFLMFQEKPTVGIVFAALAFFFWFGYFRTRRLRAPQPQRTVFRRLAIFYTLLPLLFRIQDHRIIWVFFSDDAMVGSVFIAIAVVLWIAYFVMRFGDLKFPLPFTGGRLYAGAWRIKRK